MGVVAVANPQPFFPVSCNLKLHAHRGIGNTKAQPPAWNEHAKALTNEANTVLIAQMLEKMFSIDRCHGMIGKWKRLAHIEAEIGFLVQIDIDPAFFSIGAASDMKLAG